MRKLRSVLCLLCLAALIPLLGRARRFLPQDNRALVEKKYAGWSGVLRLWYFPGWMDGADLAAWLNRCARSYEAGHPGVYVQPQEVDAGAIADFRESGIRPPDMLLFPAGLLEDADGLVPLESAAPRPGLLQTGACAGAVYALPVAMGGYIWAYDAGQIDAVPGSWRDADAILTAPEDDDWHSWSAALLALCSGRYSDDPGTGGAPDAPGLDLGLPGGAPSPAPSPAPAPESGRTCALPEDFERDAGAFRRFTNGEAAALPVTQREVKRLRALSDQGRGPDWRLAASGAVFTDQLLFLAVVDKPDAQAELCRAFADHLLEDACQYALSRYGAFGVTGAESGYAANDPLAQMDAALRGGEPAVPNAFESDWRETAEALARKLAEGSAEAPALWRALVQILREGSDGS